MLDDYHRGVLQRLKEQSGMGTMLDVDRHPFVVVVGGVDVAHFSTLDGAMCHGAVVPRTTIKKVKAKVYVLDRTTGKTFDVHGTPVKTPEEPPEGPTEDALKDRGVLET
jgi:hypothetical protein